jgi:hypothetical protein
VTTAEPVTVDHRFHGHPAVAFGGYVAGLLAGATRAAVKVDFHRPAPIGRPMRMERDRDTAALLLEGQTLATAAPYLLDELEPPTLSLEEATDATRAYLAARLVEEDCFGCGPARAADDGLRIFTGPTVDGTAVAAAWEPGPAFAAPDGRMRREFVWAALDCPGGWARRSLANVSAPGLTAYLAANLRRPVRLPGRYVVTGWLIRRGGRKTTVGSAITAMSGELCAVAEALWIDAPLPPAPVA